MNFWTLVVSFLGAAVGGVITAFLGLRQQQNDHNFERRQNDRNERFLDAQEERDIALKKELQKQNDKLAFDIQEKNEELTREMKKVDIDANIKASARIDWITNVRELTADYITALFKYNDLLVYIRNQDVLLKFSSINLNQEEEIKERKDETKAIVKNQRDNIVDERLMTTKNEIISLSEKILMQFSKNEEHIEIEKAISESVQTIKKASEKARLEISEIYYEQVSSEIISQTETIRDLFRVYLKTEWDKAKEGK